MLTLHEAVTKAKEEVAAGGCLQLVRKTENGFELQAVCHLLEVEADVQALVSDSEVTVFKHTAEAIVAEVISYRKRPNG